MAILKTVLALSKEDAALARIFAEKKKLETSVKNSLDSLKKGELELAQKGKALAEKQNRFNAEDAAIKEEQAKLADRRKQLSSLGNYKTQQAASREIEHTARELGAREEALLLLMNELEHQTAEEKKFRGELEAKKKTHTDLKVEVDGTLVTLEERQLRHSATREELAKGLSPADLVTYDKIKNKYPMDPAVLVKSGNCAGCFMQVPPQLVVQIMKGETINKCRGCGRILFLEEKEGESNG